MRFFVLFLRHFYLFVVLFERGGERDGETEGEREGVREETNIKGRRNGEKEREREREMGPRLPIPCFSLPLSPSLSRGLFCFARAGGGGLNLSRFGFCRTLFPFSSSSSSVGVERVFFRRFFLSREPKSVRLFLSLFCSFVFSILAASQLARSTPFSFPPSPPPPGTLSPSVMSAFTRSTLAPSSRPTVAARPAAAVARRTKIVAAAIPPPPRNDSTQSSGSPLTSLQVSPRASFCPEEREREGPYRPDKRSFLRKRRDTTAVAAPKLEPSFVFFPCCPRKKTSEPEVSMRCIRPPPARSSGGLRAPDQSPQGVVDTGATALEGSEAKSETRKGQERGGVERAHPFFCFFCFSLIFRRRTLFLLFGFSSRRPQPGPPLASLCSSSGRRPLCSPFLSSRSRTETPNQKPSAQ